MGPDALPLMCLGQDDVDDSSAGGGAGDDEAIYRSRR